MESLSDFEKLLPVLSRGERRRSSSGWFGTLMTIFPVSTHGRMCAAVSLVSFETRIPVWLLEQARRLGASEQALLAAYPNLRAEDLVNAWAYARSHADEIESQIRENETA